MRKIFDIDGSLNSFLTVMYQIMLINVLTVIFSLPILTMGSAVSAGYQLLMEQGTRPVNLKRFVECFKDNLKVGTVLTLIHLLTVLVLVQVVSSTIGTPFQFLSLFVLSFVALVCMNTLLVTARLKLNVVECLKFSLALTMRYTGFFCVNLAILAISFLIPIFLPKLMFLWFFLGIGLPMFLQVKIFGHCIDRFQHFIEEGAIN